MKKFIILCLVLAVLVIGGSPFWTLYQLKNAYDNQQADVIISHIDFPSLQTSLKNQLTSNLTQKSEKITNSPLIKALGIEVDVPKIIQKMVNYAVENALTPANVKQLLNNTSNIDKNTQILGGLVAIALDKIDIQTLLTARDEHELRKKAIQQLNAPNPNASKQETTANYCGFNCFAVKTQVHGYPITIQMQRQNWINWQIVAVNFLHFTVN